MGRKRGRPFEGEESAKRRRSGSSYTAKQSGDKCHNKGLRHFSQRVCEKVRQKGNTTYNEVCLEGYWHSKTIQSAKVNLLVQHYTILSYMYIKVCGSCSWSEEYNSTIMCYSVKVADELVRELSESERKSNDNMVS